MNKCVISLSPKGRLNVHSFDVVVVQRRLKRGKTGLGEKMGYFQPCSPSAFCMDGQSLAFWLNRGAKVHPTVLKYMAGLAGGVVDS